MSRGLRVRECAPGDRPRERLDSVGPSALSDSEILALLLGTGGPGSPVLELSARVLAVAGGPGGLARMTGRELATISGMGPAKAAEIVAALELGRRASRALAAERIQIFTASDAAELLKPRLAHLDREESIVVILDRKHRVLREASVGAGGVAHSPMEAREVFASALRQPGAAAVLVAHNHPSGDPTPSIDDVMVTRRLKQGANLLGLEFLDHIIVAATGCASVCGSSMV